MSMSPDEKLTRIDSAVRGLGEQLLALMRPYAAELPDAMTRLGYGDPALMRIVRRWQFADRMRAHARSSGWRAVAARRARKG